MKTLNELIGQKIVNLHPLTAKEATQEGWDLDSHGATMVVELESGLKLIPSQDDEGNGPGTMFAHQGKECYTIWDRRIIK